MWVASQDKSRLINLDMVQQLEIVCRTIEGFRGGHWLINCVTGFDDYSVCIGRYTSSQEATNALKKVVQAQEDGKFIYSMPLCTELDGQYLVEPGERQQWRVNPGCRVYF